MLHYRLQQFIDHSHQSGLYRQRLLPPDDIKCIQFNSNDYLSLTNESLIRRAYQTGFERYPVGSGGSMVVCGYHPIHRRLEKSFAETLNVDDCLLFSSGFMANLSIMMLLAQQNAHVVIDKSIHASIYDGLKLSNAQYTRYLHNNFKDLSSKLINLNNPDTVIMTESIFSMSGEISALDQLYAIANLHKYDLLIDEAHAFGIVGEYGMGSISQHGLTQTHIPLRVLPLGKAFGASGCIVAGQSVWIEALLQAARPFIYSTAISPAVAYALLKILPFVISAEDRRKKLQTLIHYFQASVKQSPLKWKKSFSPIQQLSIGSPYAAMELAQKLRDNAIICTPMRYPTVSKQATGLRIVLNYHHQPEHIDLLLKIVAEFAENNNRSIYE